MFSLRSLGPLTTITTSSPATPASISAFMKSLALLIVKVELLETEDKTLEAGTINSKVYFPLSNRSITKLTAPFSSVTI